MSTREAYFEILFIFNQKYQNPHTSQTLINQHFVKSKIMIKVCFIQILTIILLLIKRYLL